jgi:hypothetical protein
MQNITQQWIYYWKNKRGRKEGLMQATEQRESQRTAFGQIVEFELSAAHSAVDFSGLKALGIDISSGGIGLETDNKLRRDDVVRLAIPFDDKINFPVLAEVRWVAAATDEGYRIGFRFLA